MKPHIATIATLAAASLLAGCAGTKNILMTSQTNVGVAYGTKPPELRVDVSRDELILQPVFAGGKTLPTVMGFGTRTRANFFQRFFFGVGSFFSTGNAAAILTSENATAGNGAGTIEVEGTDSPESYSLQKAIAERNKLSGPGIMRPLYFGTRTNFGAHVAWDTTTGIYPSSANVGYHRKEFAWAPVTWEHGEEGTIRVGVPSTYAEVHAKMEATGSRDGKTDAAAHFQYGQYVATGQAAENMAAKAEVRARFAKPSEEFQKEQETKARKQEAVATE